MTKLVVWFLAKSEDLVFPLPDPEAGGQFGLLVTPDGGPPLSHNSAPRDGGVVWIIHHRR